MTNLGLMPDSFTSSTLHYDMLLKDWNRNLMSNNGLFARSLKTPQIVGPKFAGSGIEGYSMAIESSTFYKVASPEQTSFYDYLMNTDMIKAKQYVLVVINGLDIWKKGIAHIQKLLSDLGKSQHLLDDEMKDIILDDVDRIHKLREMLKEVLTVFEINKMVNDMDLFIRDLQTAEERLKSVTENITRQLDLIKVDFPFIFSSMSKFF